MPTDAIIYRPAPRWLRTWAVVTVLVAAAVVVLGGLVTSFRVGMSDPVWPTEPWVLAANDHVWVNEPSPGFLIEHTHRLAAWSIGALAAVLAVGAWAYAPDRQVRRFGLAAVLFLLAAYLGLHVEMRAAMKARQPGAPALWPVASGVACVMGLAAVAAACAADLRTASRGRWVRLVATVSLVGVMIQGLLGGYRVYLDQLMGTELAAIHGAFAQVVFCLLTALAVLASPRRPGDTLAAEDHARVARASIAVVTILIVQLVWGVWLRHVGSPVAQRLHVLTAFAATGVAVWLCVRALATPGGRRHLGFLAYHLLGILALQVLLGVEAWMGKFAAAGPQAATPPQFRTVTPHAAGVRTAHVLIGTALLAAAVVFAIRVWRKPAAVPDDDASPARTARR